MISFLWKVQMVKSRETDRLAVARVWEDVQELDGDLAQPCEYVKNHQVVTL